MNKPPIGIVPREIRDAHQIVELCRAISQYTAEYLFIDDMRKWVDELRELVNRNTSNGEKKSKGVDRMSDLKALENIRIKNGDIRAFPISSNMIEANTGKDGWGHIKIAINNQSVGELFTEKLTGILYLVDVDEF
jgi:hypothetical protein